VTHATRRVWDESKRNSPKPIWLLAATNKHVAVHGFGKGGAEFCNAGSGNMPCEPSRGASRTIYEYRIQGNSKAPIISRFPVRLGIDRGAPLTKAKRSRRTLKKTKLQSRQRAARPFDRLVRPSNAAKAQPPPTKIVDVRLTPN